MVGNGDVLVDPRKCSFAIRYARVQGGVTTSSPREANEIPLVPIMIDSARGGLAGFSDLILLKKPDSRGVASIFPSLRRTL